MGKTIRRSSKNPDRIQEKKKKTEKKSSRNKDNQKLKQVKRG